MSIQYIVWSQQWITVQERASSKHVLHSTGDETQVEVYLCSLTASGPWTVRLASRPWLWSLEPAFQFVPCLQPSSVWPDYRRRKQFMRHKVFTLHNCASFFKCVKSWINHNPSSFTGQGTYVSFISNINPTVQLFCLMLGQQIMITFPITWLLSRLIE